MKKYSISKDFKMLAGYRPPVNAFVAWLGRVLWWAIPKGKKIGGITQRKFFLKNPNDGGKFEIVLFEKPSQEKSDKVDKKTSAFIYFHGGAFLFGPIWAHYNNARRYVNDTGCKFFLVRYRLAPRHAYPKGVQDCEYAYRYVVNNADDFGVSLQRIAVGGDSAGGFMALSVLRYAMCKNLPLPKLLMLLYPVVSPNTNYPSMQEFTDTPVWNSRANQKMWKLFAQGKDVDCDWENVEFEKISQIYVETAQFDCLADPARSLAEKISQKGGCVVLNQTEGTIHGFDVIKKSKVAEECQKVRLKMLSSV